jgi:hypothetical protein
MPRLEYYRERSKKYAKDNLESFGGSSGLRSLNIGSAAEYFVTSWLLARQIEVGAICSKQSHHDLVALVGNRWYTIQVKMGIVNKKTGYIHLRSPKKRIWSDLVAVVDLKGFRLRWVSMNGDVPTELLEQ